MGKPTKDLKKNIAGYHETISGTWVGYEKVDTGFALYINHTRRAVGVFDTLTQARKRAKYEVKNGII